jgi:hypothetical protein
MEHSLVVDRGSPRHRDFPLGTIVLLSFLLLGAVISANSAVSDSASPDRKAVAALDVAYQKAVEQNDAKTMAKILADDFVVVDGYGKAWTKADLIQDASTAGRPTTNIRSILKGRCDCGATPLSSLRNSGRKASKTVNRSTMSCGSATRTCARPVVGSTSLVSHPCLCQRKSTSSYRKSL